MGTYYKKVEDYLDRIDNGCWIEVGVDRGEGSTKFLSDLAGARGVDFHGVDMDPDQIARATENLSVDGKLPDHVTLACDRGENYIQQLSNDNPELQASLVYLDNFDWDYWLGGQEEAFVAGVKQNYRDKLGVEMTNVQSQVTHLLQAIYLMNMMSENSIIVCDDTWYHPNEGVFIGKCSAVIPYLFLNGFSLLHNQGYRQNSGAILGRFKTV
jgi:hypothetical protein